MDKFCFGIITAMFTILVFACGKDDDTCHGCGIDTTVKEYSFPINGRMLADCSGEFASNRTLELKVFYKEDSLVVSGHTDSTGYFSLTYTQLLPGDYAFSSSWESYCLLHVVEDSVTFFLSGLAQHTSLDLQVGDSLDIDFYVNYINNPLQAADSIYFKIKPGIVPSDYAFKIGGPIEDNALVHTIKDKWRFIELDEDDKPVFKYFAIIKRGVGNNGIHGYLPSGVKEQCIMSHLDLVTLIN